MNAYQILFVSVLILRLEIGSLGVETTNSHKGSIPFSYKLEQHATSAVHTSYVLRLDYLPKTEEEITATCVLTRKGHFAGIFPLRLQRDEKKKSISFSVQCLAKDLVEEAR